jgi:hypothetical protein
MMEKISDILEAIAKYGQDLEAKDWDEETKLSVFRGFLLRIGGYTPD